MMNGSNNIDEREKIILSGALASSAIFAYLYEMIIIIMRLNNTRDIKTVYIEIGLLCTMFVIMSAFYITNNKHDKTIEKTKIKKRNRFIKIDERQRKLTIESLAAAGAISIVYEVFVIAFKLFKIKSFAAVYIEIGLVVIMGIIINLYHSRKKEYSLPKTFFGRILPMGSSKTEKRVRFKNYCYDAFILSIIFLGIDIYFDNTIFSIHIFKSKILLYAINFLLGFIILFGINHLWGEFNIAKYNKYYKSLQDDDI